MLCSEILNLHVQPRVGRERELKANLEEIWPAGALLRTDERIQAFASLWFVGGSCKFQGKMFVRTFTEGLGYFVEMRFHPDCKWSERKYRPRHLFNPLVLLANRIFEATLHSPKNSFVGHRPAILAPKTGAWFNRTLES